MFKLIYCEIVTGLMIRNWWIFYILYDLFTKPTIQLLTLLSSLYENVEL